MTYRTAQAAPVKSAFNGKWACVFQTFAMHNGAEYMAGELETAAVWFSSDAALLAGERALQTLEQTGAYPNMCELW